tara:strand:+ start:354 stop:578 length:225 start_codon:yes stop_codon:yes gene_type:complete
MGLVKVKEHSNLIKDSRTGQIVDCDSNAHQRYLAGKKARQLSKQKALTVEEDLANLKNEISEIKSLLKELVNGN